MIMVWSTALAVLWWRKKWVRKNKSASGHSFGWCEHKKLYEHISYSNYPSTTKTALAIDKTNYNMGSGEKIFQV